MKALLLSFIVGLNLNFAFSGDEDHPMSQIKGQTIELSTKGHSIAGRVGDKLILGDVSENGHKISAMIMKTKDGFLKTSFQNTNGKWGGEIKNVKKKMMVEFVRLDKSIPAYFINFGGKEYKVRVEADDFKDNHFINPTYILEKADGTELSAKMIKGQACYMYSLHLIFMIFGSFLY